MPYRGQSGSPAPLLQSSKSTHVAKSSDNTADDKLRTRVRGDLQNRPQHNYRAPYHQSLPSTEPLTKEQDKEGAEKTANLVNADHDTRNRRPRVVKNFGEGIAIAVQV